MSLSALLGTAVSAASHEIHGCSKASLTNCLQETPPHLQVSKLELERRGIELQIREIHLDEREEGLRLLARDLEDKRRQFDEESSKQDPRAFARHPGETAAVAPPPCTDARPDKAPQPHFHGLAPKTAELIYLVAEECAESTQAAMKILRHGLDSSNPFVNPALRETNRRDFEKEIGHICAAVSLLINAGIVVEKNILHARDLKIESVKSFLHHQ